MTLKSTITSPFLPFIFLVLVLEVSAQGQENEKQSDDSKANPAVVESETSGLTNGDFEELDGEVPKDWVFPTPGVNNYRYSVEEGNAFTGNNCVLIDATQANNFMGFASFSRTLDLSQYLGQRIRYRAAVRVESESKGRAQLWLRCDTVNDEGETVMQAFDNMQNRPITEPQWQHYEIVADVSDDTEEIIIGVLVIGRAKVWFDDVTIEVVEADVSTTTMFGGASDTPQSFWTWWLLPAASGLLLFGIGLFYWKENPDSELDLEQGSMALSGTGMPVLNTIQKFAFRFTLIYWVLYFFPTPFDSILAPFGFNIRAGCNEWIGELVPWTGSYVLGLDVAYEVNGSGDTTYDYVRVLTFFLIALVAAGAWTLVDRREQRYVWLKDGLYSYLRYALAILMMGYGLAKLGEVMNQFPVPSNQRLSQRIGETSPMGLLWTFMGASRPYTYFAGFGEVVAGCLLVWRRTSVLGALVAIGVMTNVVMLNFCYDVPVKLFSVHLLIAAILVLAPDFMRLTNVFLLNRAAPRRRLWPPYTDAKTIWIQRFIKLAFIVLLIAFPVYSHLKMEFTEKKIAPAFFGSYKVDEYRFSGQPDSEESDRKNRWKSVELIRYPFAVKEQGTAGSTDVLQIHTEDGVRISGVFELSEDESTLELPEPLGDLRLDFNVEVVDENQVQLTGSDEAGELFIKLRRDDKTYLLMERGFRWINNIPYNR